MFCRSLCLLARSGTFCAGFVFYEDGILFYYILRRIKFMENARFPIWNISYAGSYVSVQGQEFYVDLAKRTADEANCICYTKNMVMYRPGSNSVSYDMISAKVNDLTTFWEYHRENICDAVHNYDVPCNSRYQVVCQHA